MASVNIATYWSQIRDCDGATMLIELVFYLCMPLVCTAKWWPIRILLRNISGRPCVYKYTQKGHSFAWDKLTWNSCSQFRTFLWDFEIPGYYFLNRNFQVSGVGRISNNRKVSIKKFRFNQKALLFKNLQDSNVNGSITRYVVIVSFFRGHFCTRCGVF